VIEGRHETDDHEGHEEHEEEGREGGQPAEDGRCGGGAGADQAGGSGGASRLVFDSDRTRRRPRTSSPPPFLRVRLVALCVSAVTAVSPGCASEPAPLPAGTGAEACAAEPYEQLRTTCLVEAGARAGREGDGARAQTACDAVPEGTWRDECHFRSGEELGRAGKVADALAHCGQAGRFATFCTTHAGWGIPPSDEPLSAWLSAVPKLPEALRDEGTDILRGRWWFNHYFGTGAADPAAAKAAPPEEAAQARGGWALEAVRLLDGDLAAARAAWEGGPVPTGAAIDRRLGRYDAPFKIPGEDKLPRIRTYGSSLRFLEATTGETFRPFLTDPRPRVRYTALRCYRTLFSPDAEGVLTALAGDPDPIVVAHVKDALKYKTWMGKPNAPGLRKGK
jgi:hypothetical protein